MVDAFVHPPRIVVVGERRELGDDRLLIISHVELWPWRVVVRGAMANRRPTTIDPMDHEASRTSFREHASWMRHWLLSDDAGTDYSGDDGGTGGWITDIWAGFHVEFQPPVPEAATGLRIRSPEGTDVTVPPPGGGFT